jgi:hypothetical protein
MTKKFISPVGRPRSLRSAKGGRRFVETVEVRNNLVLTARERGKIVARREGHNIWLNLGREYLASLIDYISFSPLTPERNDRIQYMGVGIGGTRQLALGVANSPPCSVSYPGSNAQTDTDPTITTLERPVRVSGGSSTYPGLGGDVWLGQVQAPATHGTATEVTFNWLMQDTDVSYSPFLTVPLSEVMLFTADAEPSIYNNTGVAYDTFDTLSKTNAFDLEIAWTVRF